MLVAAQEFTTGKRHISDSFFYRQVSGTVLFLGIKIELFNGFRGQRLTRLLGHYSFSFLSACRFS